jgi:hypothetical protein
VALEEYFDLSSEEIAAFRSLFPGPYRSAKLHSDYGFPIYHVVSETTGGSVISVYENSFRGQARFVTSVIADALNKLQ